MALLAPIYLIGLVAAGIPLILHLVYRRKAPKLFFPTIRFLRISNERTAHRRRIQDLLLLLLRTLLFILIAFALSQFVLKLTEGAGLLRAKAAVAIVVDNSYSMGAEHEDQPRYAAAKEAALAIVRSMRASDEGIVVFTSGPERRTKPEFGDHAAVLETINTSEVSAEGGNVAIAVREALELLARRAAAHKELYVLTDLQKRTWEMPRAKRGERVDRTQPTDERDAIPIVVFDAGRPGAKNLAVHAIHVSGHAFVSGTPVTIDADIGNAGPEPAGTTVVLVVDGVVKSRRKMDLAPASTATASFAYELPKSGLADVEVRLADDALAVDNTRHFNLEVKERIRALIVQDARSAVEFLDHSYFLERALDPSIVLGGESISIIRPDRALLKDFERTKLRDYDVIFLLNIPTMSDAAAAALTAFVRDGGGVVFFAGDELDADAYRRLFGAGDEPLLPLPLLPVDKAEPDRRRFTQVTAFDESHFVFGPFRGLNLFKMVRVYKSAKIDLHAETPMRALAHLADGQPLLLEHASGRGRVVFCTVSANAEWSNLPVTDVFLPMIHQLVYHVCGSLEEARSLAVGARQQFSFPETAEPVNVDISRPDGTEESVATAPTADANEAAYTKTFMPGYYAYSTRGAVEKRGAFVVNPDTAESDLTRIESKKVAGVLAPAHVDVCSSIADMETRMTRLREGVPLRDLFVFIAITVAVFETVISNWVTPKQETQKQPTLAPAEESAGG